MSAQLGPFSRVRRAADSLYAEYALDIQTQQRALEQALARTDAQQRRIDILERRVSARTPPTLLQTQLLQAQQEAAESRSAAEQQRTSARETQRALTRATDRIGMLEQQVAVAHEDAAAARALLAQTRPTERQLQHERDRAQQQRAALEQDLFALQQRYTEQQATVRNAQQQLDEAQFGAAALAWLRTLEPEVQRALLGDIARHAPA